MRFQEGKAKTGLIIGINTLVIDCITLVERFPIEGQAVRGLSQERYPGGKGPNAILAAHKAGAPAKFYSTVHPEDAAFLVKNLKDNEIDISGIKLSEETQTVIANITQNIKTGDHTVVTINGKHDISAEMVSEADFNSENTFLLQAKLSEDILSTLISKADQINCAIVLNFCPVKKLDQKIVSKVDLIVINEHEAREICNLYQISNSSEDKEITKDIASFFKVTTIMTRGPKEVILANQDSALKIYPAIKLDNVVSPLGAGDAFVGVLTARLHLGDNFDTAIKKAIIASSIVCTEYAPQSCPAIKEIIATSQ